MRKGLIPIALAASLSLCGTASANPVNRALEELNTIDSALAECWRARALGVIIVVKFLRECVVTPRGEVRELRSKLNAQIGTLSGEDTERADLMDARLMVDNLRTFLNKLDAGLKPFGDKIGQSGVDQVLENVCEQSWSGTVYGSEVRSRTGGFQRVLPSLCEEL